VYPQLPKALRLAPNKDTHPDDHLAWARALQQHHRLYHRTTPAHEIVLDGFGRWCLKRLHKQRAFLPGSKQADAQRLFLNAQGEALTREAARTLVTHKVTAAARAVMPDAPAITFARLRHTFWAHAVAGAGVHPMLAQMEAGRARPELYSHTFYACVSPARLRAWINAAQAHLMSQVHKAHADAMHGWAKALGHVIQPLQLLAADAHQTGSAMLTATQDELHFGSTYCVRRTVLRRLMWAMLREMAGIDARHADDDTRACAWADAQVYACVLLTGICLGARVGEVARLPASAVDIHYTPALVTLLGKGNRFVEESRTLMIPRRLVPLWRAALPAHAAAASMPAFLLHRQGSAEKRPLKREDVWRHVMALSARAGLRGDASDGVIRFHALRHHLVSFFLDHGVRWAHDAYWTGHQTAGAELLHPATTGSLQAMWAEMAPALDALLDALGITDAVIAAMVMRDGPALSQLAEAMRPQDVSDGSEKDGEDGNADDDDACDVRERRSTGRANTISQHNISASGERSAGEAGESAPALAHSPGSEGQR
jgi:site-specific recombinase XerD